MLRVSLLGEQVIARDGRPDRAHSARAAALVAFLALHAGAPQARPRIAGLFWPDSTEAQARTNLRRELHHLRQLLGAEPALVVTSRDLCWHDSDTCRVDLREFLNERECALAAAASGDDDAVCAHAGTAVDRYRGDLLPGVYEDWLLDARSRLRRQCAELCDLLAAARARQGDLAGAAAAARRRIELEPMEEAGYRALMRLQADLGDRAGALSTYHHCASVLERELGVSPDPATQREFQRLLAGPGAAGPAPAARGRPGVAAAPFIGRDAELARLRELWLAAAAGRPALAVIRGDPGVGKTRLAATVAGQAGRVGAVVVTSQCFGGSGRLALAPVADWLRHPAVQAATATLAPAWRAEVARLVPAGEPARPAGGPGALTDGWQRHRFLEGLARALLAAGRPILAVLDNLQWCDEETLGFLTFCLRLAPDAPVAVLATLREGAGGPGLAGWLDRMRAAGLLTEIPLRPFETADTARLAAAISGGPVPASGAGLLQATTGGFPLYIVEAMRAAADPAARPLTGRAARPLTGRAARPLTGRAARPLTGRAAGPPGGSLAAVLARRLEQTTAAARDVAGLAAAVGADFTLDLLTEASDLDADVVAAAVDELWRHRIVRELGDGYDFSHDLLRDAAYELVSPPRRWLAHRRLAQGLELLHAADPEPVAAQLAGQYERGGRTDRAVTWYRRAAQVAAGRFAHAEAVRLHEAALALIARRPAGRDRDRQELAVLQAMSAPLNARDGYSAPGLRAVLERSVVLAETLGRNDLMANALSELSTSLFVRGHPADCYATASRALALTEPGSGPAGGAHFCVGGSAISLGRPAEGARHLDRAAELGGRVWMFVGTRADVHGLAWAAHAHWLLGHPEAAADRASGAVRLARRLGHQYSLAVALAYGAITGQMSGDTEGLRATVTDLRDLCERYDFAYYREWGLILDGWLRGGTAGLELARRGLASLRAADSLARMPYWLSLLADLLARDGRPDAARAALDEAVATARAHEDLWWLPEVLRMRAGYDRPGPGRQRLAEAAALARAHGSVALARRCERDLAG